MSGVSLDIQFGPLGIYMLIVALGFTVGRIAWHFHSRSAPIYRQDANVRRQAQGMPETAGRQNGPGIQEDGSAITAGCG